MDTIGVYAGSFNPLHIGHLNIIDKASKIFDTVIVSKGFNPEKDKANNFELPIKYLATAFDNVTTNAYSGLLSDYLNEIICQTGIEPTLIRGLRNSLDFEYEKTQIKWIKEFYPNLKVVHIMCDPDFEHISSSAIRNLIGLTDIDKYIVKNEKFVYLN